jgi:hypothetical protein
MIGVGKYPHFIYTDESEFKLYNKEIIVKRTDNIYRNIIQNPILIKKRCYFVCFQDIFSRTIFLTPGSH